MKSPQCKSPVKRHPSTKQSSTPRRPFAPEEDQCLVELKGQGLPWKEVHRQYSNAFPELERAEGTLRVRSTKLGGRQTVKSEPAHRRRAKCS